MTAQLDLLVVGPIAQDVTLRIAGIPPAGGSVSAEEAVFAPGGKGGNPAVAATRLGARVRLLGAVGDDRVGAQVLDDLTHDGVDVTGVERLPGIPTGYITHLVEPEGRRRYVELPGANDALALDAATVAAACTPDTVTLISTALPAIAVTAAVAGARRAGARIALDLAGPPETSRAALDGGVWLGRADADEAHALTQGAGRKTSNRLKKFDPHREDDAFAGPFAEASRLAAKLQARGARTVAVQAGHSGDLFRGPDGEEVHMNRIPVETVDPTGGGDALVTTLTVLLAQRRT